MDNAVLNNAPNMTLKFSRMNSIILEKQVSHQISINFENNQNIKFKVKAELMNKPTDEFLNKIQKKYYSTDNNGVFEMWEFDGISETWRSISIIYIGKIEIDTSTMPDHFKKAVIDKKIAMKIS